MAALGVEDRDTYLGLIERARSLIDARELRAARSLAERALQLDHMRPEAHNLLGVISEGRGSRIAAQEFYRIALELEPGFRPAQHNLARSVLSIGVARGALVW